MKTNERVETSFQQREKIMKQNYTFIERKLQATQVGIEATQNFLETGLKSSEAKSKKWMTGAIRQYDLWENISYFAKKNALEFEAPENSNWGDIIEPLVKSYLKGRVMAKSLQGQTDLFHGRNFEIKLLVKGTSSYPSSLAQDDHDVLLITNLGAKILRKENIAKAYEQGYIKPKEDKIRPTILNSDLLVETPFTERLTEEMGLHAWY